MAILTSDNLVKLAFSLPLIPLGFIIAWKLGFFNYALFPSSGQAQAYDPKTGIGRGAPGFQTNVRRIAVPRSELHKYGLAPEDEARVLAQNGGGGGQSSSISSRKAVVEENEWIPAGHGKSAKSATAAGTPGGKARRRK